MIRIAFRFAFRYGVQGLWVDDLLSLSFRRGRAIFDWSFDQELIRLEIEVILKRLRSKGYDV